LGSSAGSLFGAAGFAVVADFFFAGGAGLAAGVGLAGSSSAITSGLTTVAPAVFFVMVAELTGWAADFIVLEGAATEAVERGSPRRLSRTAFSAYSLI